MALQSLFPKHLTTTLASAALLLMPITTLAQDEVVEFNASNWLPQGHPLAYHSYVKWLPRLEEASGGTLKPNFFSGPVLMAPSEHLSGISNGIAQVGYHAGTYTPAQLPEDNVIAQLAFNYANPYPLAFAVTEANMTMPALLAQWRKNNIAYLGGYSTSPYNLLCSRKIETLADMEGAKIRVPGAAQSDWVNSVGGVPVNVPSSEMYDGLDKGQLDCAAITALDLKSRSLWDVTSYVTLLDIGLYWAGYSQGANRDFWQGLSDAQRQAFFDTIPTAMVDEVIDYMGDDREALEEAANYDVEVIQPAADLQTSVDEFRAQVRANAIAQGNDTFGLSNTEQLLSDFEAIVAKWEKRLEGMDHTDRDEMIRIAETELFGQLDAATYAMD